MTQPFEQLQEGDALLIVDVQNDFCPGGALPVDEGDAVIPVLNDWIDAARAAGVPVYASRDWHPLTHLSFREYGGEWPTHCVQDSEGAEFHPGLDLGAEAIVVTKGTRFDQDQYSAFDQTGLAAELKRRGLRRLWVGGLAYEICVRATALDAVREGFEVRLIEDACRAITPEGKSLAHDEMRQAGVILSAAAAPR